MPVFVPFEGAPFWWRVALGPDHGIDAEHPLVIDLDATLVSAHSDNENAAATFERGFGFHPLFGFVDHGVSCNGFQIVVIAVPAARILDQHRPFLILDSMSIQDPRFQRRP